MEILTINENSGVKAAITEVSPTTDLYSSDGGNVKPKQVPSMGPKHRYIPWGEDNKLPFAVARLLGDCEVTAENVFFNVLTCYGAGLCFHEKMSEKPARNSQAEEFSERNSLPEFLLNQMTDMKHYFFSVCVFILSNDLKRINRIVHKEACYCRMQEADESGRIRHIYYSDWEKDSSDNPVEVIPLLDERDPIGDLMQLMGREPGDDGVKKVRTKAHKFAMLMKFPTVANRYYPIPYFASIFRGGSYDEIQLISAAKRAKLKNYSSVKYLVRIERTYWGRICDEKNITDPEERKKRVKKEKENIRNFLSNIENAGKVWISGCYTDPNGREIKDVQIETVRADKEGGEWTEDVQGAVNTACYAFNIHPNLVGSVPGKAQTNNSGSDKRELFTMKQALEGAFHDVLLKSLRLVCFYNGWDVRPAIDMIMLTTLDQHRDAVRVNPAQETEP